MRIRDPLIDPARIARFVDALLIKPDSFEPHPTNTDCRIKCYNAEPCQPGREMLSLRRAPT
jgi:hypothetical protein